MPFILPRQRETIIEQQALKQLGRVRGLTNKQNKGHCGTVFRRQTIENDCCIPGSMDIGFYMLLFQIVLVKTDDASYRYKCR